jgi:hypothetical protein
MVLVMVLVLVMVMVMVVVMAIVCLVWASLCITTFLACATIPFYVGLGECKAT